MVLVTGGLGYIGSHIVVELIKEGRDVIVVDNLSNSRLDVIDRINELSHSEFKFYCVDIGSSEIEKVFKENKIDSVINLAGLKSIAESINDPLSYYENNICGLINLLKYCDEYNVKKFVFSSSATVYGDNDIPFSESMVTKPTLNPYGETKLMSERILKDLSKSNSEMRVVVLRYFNPVGAHKSGKIGESPNQAPTNLMPKIIQVASSQNGTLSVYGDDYKTIDGTCIRDYVHVLDVASGHSAALKYDKAKYEVFNLGTGVGTSVLELVNQFNEVNGTLVKYEVSERREGDIAECYSSISKAKQLLGWSPIYNTDDMVKDAWNYYLMNSGGLNE